MPIASQSTYQPSRSCQSLYPITELSLKPRERAYLFLIIKYFMEQVERIELSSQPWQGRIRTIVLYLQAWLSHLTRAFTASLKTSEASVLPFE